MAQAAASRERLLKQGLVIARKQGLRAITVRGVAARARVNLGSFVYHFGSRDAFVAELLERWYAPLMAGMQLAVASTGSPLDRLRDVLLQFVDWVRANNAFIAHVAMDAASGETAARDFVGSLEQRHPALILQAIASAQAAGQLGRENPLHVMLFLLSTLALPIVLFHGAGVGKMFPKDLAQAIGPLTIDASAIEQRLAWALKGLAP